MDGVQSDGKCNMLQRDLDKCSSRQTNDIKYQDKNNKVMKKGKDENRPDCNFHIDQGYNKQSVKETRTDVMPNVSLENHSETVRGTDYISGQVKNTFKYTDSWVFKIYIYNVHTSQPGACFCSLVSYFQ